MKQKAFSPIRRLVDLMVLPQLSLLVTLSSTITIVAFLSMGLSVNSTVLTLVTLDKLAEQVPICC